MKRILTAAALAISLLLSGSAYAGDLSAKDKDNFVTTIMAARIHEKICGTEQSPGVKKMTALMEETIGSDWSKDLAQAKVDEIKADFNQRGIGPWCREVTAAFRKWAE